MYEYFRNTSSTAGHVGKEIVCQVGLSGVHSSCYVSRLVAWGRKVHLAKGEARMRSRYGRSHIYIQSQASTVA